MSKKIEKKKVFKEAESFIDYANLSKGRLKSSFKWKLKSYTFSIQFTAVLVKNVLWNV